MSESTNSDSTDEVLSILEPVLVAVRDGSIWNPGAFAFKSRLLPNGYRFQISIEQKTAGSARDQQRAKLRKVL